MSGAADKLARTRLALIEAVHRKEQGGRRTPMGAMSEHEGEQWDAAEAEAASGGGGWPGGVKRAARSWWRNHPARFGLQVATPMLSSYARRKPLQYLAIAAAAGAVLVVARPWRLVSVGGLLMAVARSPQLASVIMAAMSSANEDE